MAAETMLAPSSIVMSFDWMLNLPRTRRNRTSAVGASPVMDGLSSAAVATCSRSSGGGLTIGPPVVGSKYITTADGSLAGYGR